MQGLGCPWFAGISLITSVTLLLPREITACIHDKIQKNDVPSQPLSYTTIPTVVSDKYKSTQRKKRALINDFHPIRISINYDNFFQTELLPEKISTLQRVVKRVVYKVSTLLSVIPVNGSLRLRRADACFSEWTEGRNVGKCATFNRKYREETCLDEFKIPDNHLDGLSIWNKSGSEPVKEIFPMGQGVEKTDYILYVSAVMTDSCYVKEGSRLLAYATYCQTDQYGRPIAGYINVCPTQLKSDQFTVNHLYKTMFHEILHALGFSKKLFSKFQQCDHKESRIECKQRSETMFRKVNSIYRMVTSAVVRETQKQFGCYTNSRYGGPMQVQNGVIQSHWDDLLMYGSLMTPSIGLPELAVLDPVTLAVFEDSGWYQVNYKNAEKYHWGKDEGCQFGLKSLCQENTGYFCQPKTSGCHFLHEHRGTCDVLTGNSNCHVYVAKPGDKCTITTNDKSREDPTGIYDINSRCFMSNLTFKENVTKEYMTGICYLHRCRQDRQSEVKVEGSYWYLCPYGEIISIPGYDGVIRCPLYKDIMCPDLGFTSVEDNDLSVILHIKNKWCWESLDVESVKENIVAYLVDLLNIATARLNDFKVDAVTESAAFNITPPSKPGDEPTEDILNRLLQLSQSQQLQVKFDQNCISLMHISLSVVELSSPSYTISTSQKTKEITESPNNSSNHDFKDQTLLSVLVFVFCVYVIKV